MLMVTIALALTMQYMLTLLMRPLFDLMPISYTFYAGVQTVLHMAVSLYVFEVGLDNMDRHLAYDSSLDGSLDEQLIDAHLMVWCIAGMGWSIANTIHCIAVWQRNLSLDLSIKGLVYSLLIEQDGSMNDSLGPTYLLGGIYDPGL